MSCPRLTLPLQGVCVWHLGTGDPELVLGRKPGGASTPVDSGGEEGAFALAAPRHNLAVLPLSGQVAFPDDTGQRCAACPPYRAPS